MGITNNITSANAVIIYQDNFFIKKGLPLMQFATDQSVTTDAVQKAETRMGVDGKLVGGYTPAPIPLTLMFEPSSPSWRIIQRSINAADTLRMPLICQLNITIPSIAENYSLRNGFLTEVTNLNLKKVMDPITLKFNFESRVSNVIQAIESII